MKLTLRLRVYLQAHQTPRTVAEATVGLVADGRGTRTTQRGSDQQSSITNIPNTNTAVGRAGGRSRGGRGARGTVVESGVYGRIVNCSCF